MLKNITANTEPVLFWIAIFPFFIKSNVCAHVCLRSSLIAKGKLQKSTCLLTAHYQIGSSRQTKMENWSLIVRKSDCAIRTHLYWHLTPLIIPSRGTRLPGQQIMQRRQVCCVTFSPASMWFYHKYPGICARRLPLCFVTTKWSTQCRKSGWRPTTKDAFWQSAGVGLKWDLEANEALTQQQHSMRSVRKLTACSKIDQVKTLPAIDSLGLGGDRMGLSAQVERRCWNLLTLAQVSVLSQSADTTNWLDHHMSAVI